MGEFSKTGGEAEKDSIPRYTIDSLLTIIEESPNMIFINQMGRVVYVNKKCKEIMGYSKVEFTSSDFDFMNLIAPESKDLVKQNFRKHMKGEEVAPVEYKFVKKDGGEIYAIQTTKLIENEGGPAILGILTDITERKQMEKALSESEEKYRRLFENSIEGVSISKGNRIISANRAVLDIMGYESLDEYLKVPLLDKLAPESREKAIERMKRRDKGESLNPWDEVKIVRKDGEIRDLEVSSNELVLGNEEYVQSTIRDITERKKTEEELKNIFNLSPDMVGVLSTDGKFVKINTSWEKVLGYTKEELLKVGWAGFVHPDDVEKTNKEVEKQLKGSSVVNFVNRYRCKDGSYKTLEWQASFAKDGIVYATARDITERKKAEEDLEHAYDELKILDVMKKNLIANVTHELRTPLTIATTALELALDEKNESEKDKLMHMGMVALKRQNITITDLMMAAYLENQEKVVKREPVHLHEIVEKVANEFNAIIQKNKLKLEIHIKSDLPTVLANSKRLHHVIRNLLHNAIKFNYEGGEITIKARKVKDMCECCIINTGVGIPRDQIDLIFDRFYQVDSTSTRTYGGAGIGLSIVKGVVEDFGGRVTVESEEGKKTRFCFTLPLA